MTGSEVALPAELAGLPVAIIVLTAALAGVGLPSRWKPVVAVGLGVAAMVTTIGLTVAAVIAGVIVGASAVGIHQVGRGVTDGGIRPGFHPRRRNVDDDDVADQQRKAVP